MEKNPGEGNQRGQQGWEKREAARREKADFYALERRRKGDALQREREGLVPQQEAQSEPVHADTSSVKPAMPPQEKIAAAGKSGEIMQKGEEKEGSHIPGSEPFVPSAVGEEEIEKTLSSGAKHRRLAEENVAYSDRLALLNLDIHKAQEAGDASLLAVLEDMKHALVQGAFVPKEGAREVERNQEPKKEKPEEKEVGVSEPVTAVASKDGKGGKESEASGELPKSSIEERLRELVRRGDLNTEDLRRRTLHSIIAKNPREVRALLEEGTSREAANRDDGDGLEEALLHAEKLKGELELMKEEVQGEGEGEGQEKIRIQQEAYRKLTGELTSKALVLLGTDHWLKNDEAVLERYAQVNQSRIERRLGLLELRGERRQYAAAQIAADRVGSSWWPPTNWLKKGATVRTERAEREGRLKEAERAYAAKKEEVVRENLHGRLREHERETKVLGDAAVERAKGALMERLRLGLSWLGEQNLYNRLSPEKRKELGWAERNVYKFLSARSVVTYGLLGISAATGSADVGAFANVGAGVVVGLRAMSALSGFLGARIGLRTLWEKYEFKELSTEKIRKLKPEQIYEEFAARVVRARLGGRGTREDPTVRRLRREAAEKAREAVEKALTPPFRTIVEELNRKAEDALREAYGRRIRGASESGKVSLKEVAITGGAVGVAAFFALGLPKLIEKAPDILEKIRDMLSSDELPLAGVSPGGEAPSMMGSVGPVPPGYEEPGSGRAGWPEGAAKPPTQEVAPGIAPEPAAAPAAPPSPEAPLSPEKVAPEPVTDSREVDMLDIGRGEEEPAPPEISPEAPAAAAEQAGDVAGKTAAEAMKGKFDFDLGAIESGDSFEGKLIEGMKKSRELREAFGIDEKLSGEDLVHEIERKAHLVAIESGVADQGLNLDPETHVVVEGGKVRLEGTGGTYTISPEAPAAAAEQAGDLTEAAEKATEALAKKAQDVEGLKASPTEEWAKYAKPEGISEDAWYVLMSREHILKERLQENTDWLKTAKLPEGERANLLREAENVLGMVKERGFGGTLAGGEFSQERYNTIQLLLAGESDHIAALRESLQTPGAGSGNLGETAQPAVGGTERVAVIEEPSGRGGVAETPAERVVPEQAAPETSISREVPKEIVEMFTPKTELTGRYPNLSETTRSVREMAVELTRLGRTNSRAREVLESLKVIWKNFNENPSPAAWAQARKLFESYAKEYGPKIEAGGK